MAEVTTKTVRCDSCGASITGISTWKPAVCDYCGSEVLVEMPPEMASAVADKPRLVPFRIDAAAAGAKLKDWLKSSFWSPGDLASAARTDEQAEIYVPAFEVRGSVDADWKGADSETHHRNVTKTRTNPQTQKTETYQDSEPYKVWNPMTGQHHGDYTEMITASGALTQDEINALTPWDAGQTGEDIGEALSSGRRMEEPSMSEEEAERIARELMEGHERSACEQLVERLDGVSCRFGDFLTQRVIVPVWVFRYRYKGKVQRAVMNGQTGELHGRRPTSALKIALAIGIPIAIVIGIIIVASLMK